MTLALSYEIMWVNCNSISQQTQLNKEQEKEKKNVIASSVPN